MTDHRITVYQDSSGEWRWHKRPTHGGDIVADSGEGYSRKSDAFEAATKEAGPGDQVEIPGEHPDPQIRDASEIPKPPDAA